MERDGDVVRVIIGCQQPNGKYTISNKRRNKEEKYPTFRIKRRVSIP